MNKFAVNPYNFSKETIKLLKKIDNGWNYNLNHYYFFDDNVCFDNRDSLRGDYTYLTEQEFLNMINSNIYECW